MSEIIKPIVTDETGQAIVNALMQNDIVAQKTTEINDFADAKLQEVLASLPPDYSELTTKVDEISNFVTPQMFGAKADGITDDTKAIQNAIDYAYNTGLNNVYLPCGKYRTTKPIILWTTVKYQAYEVKNSVKLVGADPSNTIIAKDGNVACELNNNRVDAVIVVVNDNYKNPNYSANVEGSSDIICNNFEISNITVQNINASIQTLVHDYGIFSNGWYFAKFNNIIVKNCKSAFYTQTWNCYSTYYYLDIQFAEVGFDFDNTHVGGNTTMLFVNCHTNGCTGYAYSFLGNATFVNCSNDGGTATVYNGAFYARNPVPVKTNMLLINCHFESEYSEHLVQLRNATAKLIKCTCEIPVREDAGSLFNLDRGSTLLLDNVRFSLRAGNESTPLKIYNSDESMIFFDECVINPLVFSEYQVLPQYSENVLFDKYRKSNVTSKAKNGRATTSITDTVNAVYDSSETSLEDGVYINLGKHDITDKQKIIARIEATFDNSNAVVYIADNIDDNGNPINYSVFDRCYFSDITGTKAVCNFTTKTSDYFTADISKIYGEKYIFIVVGTRKYDFKLHTAFLY